MANALPPTSEGIAQLFYVAYYGRPADPLGQAYWAGVIDAAGGDLSAVSDAFGASEEADAVYGGLTPLQAVNKLYNQMFGRDAEPAGLTYWAGEILAGNVALSDLPLALYTGAQGTDLDAFANKWTVANAFTAALDTTEEILAYNGIPAMAGAVDLLASVDSTDESVEAALAQIDDVIADIGSAPDTTTSLTVGLDNLVGGSGNDLFLGGTATLNLGDSIDGGAGDDRLDLTLAGNGGEGGFGLYAGFLVDNVETLNVRAIGEDSDVELSLTNVDGLQTINVLRSTNEVFLQDIQNLVDVNLDDVAQDVSIDFDQNEDVMGGADALDLSVLEVGSSADGNVSVYVDGDIEVLNIDDLGRDGFESDFNLTGYGLDAINVTGGDEYTQEAGNQQEHLALNWIDTDGGTTLDSTAFAGDLYAYTTQSDLDTIHTGAGDDEIGIDSDWDHHVGNGQGINTAAGDDTVWVYGDYDYYSGDATVNGSIETGSGSDEVYVYNDYGYYYYDDQAAVGETGLIDTGSEDDYVYLDGGIDGDTNGDDVVGTVLLGTGNDNLVIYGEDYYYGGDQGDINGLVDAGAGDDLIEVYDGTVGDGGVVMGGEGNDQLQLWNGWEGYATVVTDEATVTGVETLALGNTDYDDDDLDHDINLDAFDEALASIVIVNASTASDYADQEVNLTNLTTEAISITSTDSDDGDDVELHVEAKDASGDEDSLSVTLFGGTSGAPAAFEVSIEDEGDEGENDFEHLALENNGFGDREVDTNEEFDVSLTVTGDSTDRLRVFDSTSQLVDATAYAGDFTIEVATEQDYEILTGSGDDTINLVDDVFTNGDTLNGGDGDDRLVVDESTQTVNTEEDEAFDNVNEIEALQVLGDDGDVLLVTFDDDVDRAGIDHLIVSGQDNDDDGDIDEAANVALTIGKDYELALTIDHTNGTLTVDNDGAADIDVNLDANGGRSLIFTDASNGGEINLNVTIADGGVDTYIDNTQPGAGTDGSVLLDVDAGSIDSIVLLDSIGEDLGSGYGDNGEVYITVDDSWVDGPSTLVIDASDILDDDNNVATGGVYVDGILETDAELVFTGSENNDEATGGELDDVLVGGDGADYLEGYLGADDIDGGAGNDTLWGDDSTGASLFDPELDYADTIDGGAGIDAITGGFGGDLLTGGAGDDTFFYDAPADSQGTVEDTITDFTVGDDILSFLGTMLTGGDIVFQGNVDNDLLVLSTMTGGAGGLPPSGFSEAVYQTASQKLYVDINNDGAINDGDIVIDLTGVAELSQLDFAVHA